MEGVCGRAPATKILKLELTSYLWCLASRGTLIHWTIPWNRSSDHRFTARRKRASQQSATHQGLASLHYWNNEWTEMAVTIAKNSVAFCELKKLCLYYRMGSFSGWPSLLSWVRDGWSVEVVGPKFDLPDHLLWPCTGVSCMKPRWALFRILRLFNQPGMEHLVFQQGKYFPFSLINILYF